MKHLIKLSITLARCGLTRWRDFWINVAHWILNRSCDWDQEPTDAEIPF